MIDGGAVDGAATNRACIQSPDEFTEKRVLEEFGFAGVGVKLGLLICKEVITETRSGPVPVATAWSLTGRHRSVESV